MWFQDVNLSLTSLERHYNCTMHGRLHYFSKYPRQDPEKNQMWEHDLRNVLITGVGPGGGWSRRTECYHDSTLQLFDFSVTHHYLAFRKTDKKLHDAGLHHTQQHSENGMHAFTRPTDIFEQQLLDTGEFSDFKILCHHDKSGKAAVLRVHKAILASHSEFFHRMFKQVGVGAV